MSIYYEKYWEEKDKDELNDFKYKWTSVKNILQRLKKGKVLDFGCGAGWLLKKIIDYFPSNQYVGTDLSIAGLKRAKSKLPNVKFIQSEGGEKLPFLNNEFDIILATDVIEHVYDVSTLLSEWNRILKLNGVIVITTPYFGFIKNILISIFGFEMVFDPTGPHIRFFTDNSLKSTLEKYDFKVIQINHFGRFFPVSRGVLVVAKKVK